MNTIENCLIFLTAVEVEAYWPFMKCVGKLCSSQPAFTIALSSDTHISLSLCLASDEVVVSLYPKVTGITEKIMSQCADNLPADVPAEKLTDCASGHLGTW